MFSTLIILHPFWPHLCTIVYHLLKCFFYYCDLNHVNVECPTTSAKYINFFTFWKMYLDGKSFKMLADGMFLTKILLYAQESEMHIFLFVKKSFCILWCLVVYVQISFNHIHYSVRMNNVIRTLHLLNFLT